MKSSKNKYGNLKPPESNVICSSDKIWKILKPLVKFVQCFGANFFIRMLWLSFQVAHSAAALLTDGLINLFLILLKSSRPIPIIIMSSLVSVSSTRRSSCLSAHIRGGWRALLVAERSSVRCGQNRRPRPHVLEQNAERLPVLRNDLQKSFGKTV